MLYQVSYIPSLLPSSKWQYCVTYSPELSVFLSDWNVTFPPSVVSLIFMNSIVVIIAVILIIIITIIIHYYYWGRFFLCGSRGSSGTHYVARLFFNSWSSCLWLHTHTHTPHLQQLPRSVAKLLFVLNCWSNFVIRRSPELWQCDFYSEERKEGWRHVQWDTGWMGAQLFMAVSRFRPSTNCLLTSATAPYNRNGQHCRPLPSFIESVDFFSLVNSRHLSRSCPWRYFG